ncbi:MAG TPA: acyloxyacyl hydrolase [Acidobacteriaceae bacterium]|nr:acyloxyacyl hydrolase [Acidobacteriaceae bacterium]
MPRHQFSEPVFALWSSEPCFAGNFRPNCLSVLAAICCLLAPQLAHTQETQAASATNTSLVTNTPAETKSVVTKRTPDKEPVESEIAATSMVSYGSYKLFGAAVRCNLWTAGVEYDRHIWGYHLKSRMDYVVEVLPFVLLSEPASADKWGNPTSPNQQLVHGVGISPFGFRMLWRSNRAVKPFLIGKAGVIAFPKKVLSPSATYANFAFQGDFGLQIRLTPRVELRLDPLEYFHFSNAFLAGSNPGFDELGAKFGLSYRLGRLEH